MKKLIFYSCLLLISISASAQVPSYVPTNGLVGYWPFNGNANDESGNGNNGTVNGATLTNDRNGLANSTYSFDGINNYIHNPNWNSLVGSQEFTVNLWVKYKTSLGWLVCFGLPQNSNGFHIGTAFQSSKLYSAFWNFNYNPISNNYPFLELSQNWAMVTVKYKRDSIFQFMNGVLISSFASNYMIENLQSGQLNFGKQLGVYNEFFSGELDDIGIWNRALSQQEINSLFTQNFIANIPSYVPTNDLIGYWPFNGNANDNSGVGNNGTVIGATLTTDRFGRANNAYNFNGNNLSHIEIKDNNTMELLSNFTLSYWLNPDSLPVIKNDYISVISKGSHGVGGWITGIWNNIDNIIAFQRDGAYSNYLYGDSKSAISLNVWQNITITYNSNNDTLKYYLNGALVSAINSPGFQIIGNSFDINIGVQKKDSNYIHQYRGKLDDIVLWNRALTQSEITAIYTSIPTGINDIKNANIKIYPNPANNKITIDNGDIQKMNGYSIKIINSLGQQVYQGGITQQIVSIDITQGAGNGMYYLQLTDNNGNIVDVKKIVLQ
jgi:hypothetical protein